MGKLGNCVSCDAPAIGSVNERGFCKEHIDEVISGTVKPVMDAYRKVFVTKGETDGKMEQARRGSLPDCDTPS